MEFPKNGTNASATRGFSDGSFPSHTAFNGSLGQFQCNITTNHSSLNITRIVLFINATGDSILSLNNNSATINQSVTNASLSGTTPQTYIFNLTSQFNEGIYAWMCQIENNDTIKLINQSGTNFFIIDRSPPAFTSSVINTSNAKVSTGDTIYVTVNATDQFTALQGAVLFVNLSGIASNSVDNTTTGIPNNTRINLSFVVPGNALGQILNFTIRVNDSVSNFNITSALVFSVDGDATPPGINLNSPIDVFNQTSTTAPNFNFTAVDNNYSLSFNLTCGINISLGGSLFTNISPITATNGTPQINTTSKSLPNGTYKWNVSCTDPAGNSNTSLSRTFTVDQIPPVVVYYNFTNGTLNNTDGTSTNAYELGVGAGLSRAQSGDNLSGINYFPRSSGDKNYSNIIFAVANWSDNLTLVSQAVLQFYNNSKSAGNEWQTINTSSAALPLYNQSRWANFSFPIPIGHNNFEGNNVSFRIIANDTLGNINNSVQVKNFTIQINDTTRPTLAVALDLGSSQLGNRAVNNTNISDTTPTIVWNVTEGSSLRYIAMQVNSFTSADSGCNLFKNFTETGTPSSNTRRNQSITILGPESDCNTLTNGTQTVRLTAEDSWGNSELYLFSFTVETASPTISLTAIQNITSGAWPNGQLVSNKTLNVTPRTGLNFTAIDGGAGTLKDFSWTSSCNSAGETLSSSSSDFPTANASFIWPFNFSSCLGTETTQTVSITVTDVVGNTVTNLFQFRVDDLAPTITVHSPTEGQSFTSLASINVSAKDSFNRVESVVYYLDDSPVGTAHTTNGTITTEGLNSTILNLTVNFTPGTHKIKISVNDTLGNVRNSSVITFTQTGPIHFGEATNSSSVYSGQVYNKNITNVTLFIYTSAGYHQVNGSNETSGNMFKILFTIPSNQTNVSLSDINGSAVNWGKINFTPLVNDTSFVPGLRNNWSYAILRSIYFNNSIEEFTNNNNNSYYGVVEFPINASDRTASGPEFWWIPNENDLTTRTNISQCGSAFTRLSTEPCWNYTIGGKTIVQVPHFSIVVVVNDTIAPNITINKPDTGAGNHTVGMFEPNITVTLDTVSCKYQINQSSTPFTMTLSGTTCLGQTERFGNQNGVYNITFNATDAAGNVQSIVFQLNISDNTAPNSPNSSRVSTSVESTSATITLGAFNESVNATVFYGTALTLGSTAVQTDFNKTQQVSLSSLTASTLYYFNVTVCDYAGNCAKNITFNLTTSAAAAAPAAAASTSSGGGGGGAAAPSNEAASTSKRWDSLAEGSSAVLSISNANIAVTGVVVDIKSAVTNAEVKVASLVANPLSTAAAGKVYQYLQLTKSNIADTDASKITISFRVPKTWLTSNSVAEGDVTLYRYSDSKWNALPTTMTGSDANNALYSATTPGFSTFAIGNKEAAPAAPAAGEAPSEAPAAPGEAAPAAPAEEKPAGEAAMEKKGLSKTTIALIVIAIIIVVAIVGYSMWQKKKAE